MDQRQKSILLHWHAWAIIALACPILCYRVNARFLGQHESSGAWLSNCARNMVRYGYVGTRLGLIQNSGPIDQGNEAVYYTHAPPLVAVLASISFHIFGVHEWAARLVAILHSLMTLVLALHLGERLGGKRAGLLAGGLLLTMPMYAYYGRNMMYPTMSCPCLLLCLILWQRWVHSGRRKFLVGMYVTALWGAMLYFHGTAFPVALAAYHWTTGRRRRVAMAAGMVGVVVFVAALFLTHTYILLGWGALIDDLRQTWERRGVGAQAFLLGEVLVRQAHALVWYVGPLVLAMAGAQVAHALRQRAACRQQLDLCVLPMKHLALMLVLQGYAAKHEYVFHNSAPVFAIWAGIWLSRIWHSPAARRLVGRHFAHYVLAGAVAFGLGTTWLLHQKRPYGGLEKHLSWIVGRSRPADGVLVNIAYHAERFPCYYMPFYLDRHVRWGVRGVREAAAALTAPGSRYVLGAFFSQDPETGDFDMRVLTREHALRALRTRRAPGLVQPF